MVFPLSRANFLSACLKLYNALKHKILERSSLKYLFVWNLQALDSSFALRNKKVVIENMHYLLRKLIYLRRRKECECDNILNEFQQLPILLERNYKVDCETFFADKDHLG